MQATLDTSLRIQPEPETTRLFELGLRTRTLHCLARLHARRRRLDPRDTVRQMTVGELAEYSPAELLEIRGFGDRALREVEERLGQCGLSLQPGPRPSGNTVVLRVVLGGLQ